MIEAKEEWVVIWFPPEVKEKVRKFRHESSARAFAATEEVASWAPLLEHRQTRTETLSWLISLDEDPEVE